MRRQSLGGVGTGTHPGSLPSWLGPRAAGKAPQRQHTYLKTLILTAVQLLLVGRLLGADEGGIL